MRVVIAEDSVLLRQGITRLLGDAGVEVSDAVGDAETFLRAVEIHRPDAVIVDVRMPPTFTDEGVRAALVVRQQWPGTAVLVLSQYVEERYATELLADNAAGIGYLLKDRVADVVEFINALHEIGRGGTVVDPEVISQVFVRSRRRRQLESLTDRETAVLQAMAEGKGNAAIADELVVALGTVEKHVTNIFLKLGLSAIEDGHRRVLAVLRYLDQQPS